MLETGRCRALQRKMPAYMAEWFSAVVEVFVGVALQKAGAKSPKVTSQALADGPVAADSVVTLAYEFTWR
jgi:hypothetical protein